MWRLQVEATGGGYSMKSASVYLRVVLSLMLLMFFVHMVQGPLSAQTTNGKIQGTVHDSSGAPISGVNVTLKSLETGATQSVTTGGDGAYEFLSLPAPSPPVVTR